MSESDATVLDSTAMSNVGKGAESAGGLGRFPPRPISTEYVAVRGYFPHHQG